MLLSSARRVKREKIVWHIYAIAAGYRTSGAPRIRATPRACVTTAAVSCRVITRTCRRHESRLDGGRRRRIMCLDTIDSATSNPSFRSSPWMRGAPTTGSPVHSSDAIRVARARSWVFQRGRGISNPNSPSDATAGSRPARRPGPDRAGSAARPQPGHLHQQCAITTTQPATRTLSPQGDVELMTKKQVLGFKPALRLEQIGDIRSKQVDDCKHRIG